MLYNGFVHSNHSEYSSNMTYIILNGNLMHLKCILTLPKYGNIFHYLNHQYLTV